MSRRIAVLLFAVGGAVVVVALLLGFSPITSAGFDCGSALSGGNYATDVRNSLSDRPPSLVGDCIDARLVRKTLTLALGVPAALVFAAGQLGLMRQPSTIRAPDSP